MQTYPQLMHKYEGNIYMRVKNITEKLKTGLSLVSHLWVDRAILWHALMENGAIFYRLPISAFIQRGFKVEDVPKRRLDELELWNSFSYHPAVTSWAILSAASGKYI